MLFMGETTKNRCLWVILLTSVMMACSHEKSEYVAEAGERALVAARALVSANHDDTMQLESLILEAKAIESEYLLKGDTLAARAFESSFQEYVTANDPQLAQVIFKQK